MSKRTLPPRDRIVRAAAELLGSGGQAAVSTRAVSAAAGVQAPAIYRQFGDMRGLLDAAAREVLAGYVRQKTARVPSTDPIADLRHGWDEHVAFGLANPAAYALLYGGALEEDSPAARDGYEVLERHVRRVAEAGRLRVTVAAAARLIHAGGSGVTLSLIATAPEHRDPRLSETMREAVIAAITVSSAKPARGAHDVAARAVALKAVLEDAAGSARGRLSPGERALLGELLDRLAVS